MENNCKTSLCEKPLMLENASIVNSIINLLKAKEKKYLAIMPLSLDFTAVKTIRDIAFSLFSLNRRVLLIDATSRDVSFIAEDVRKGLSEYVCNDASLSECVYQESEGYDLMPAGNFGDGISVLHNVCFDDKIIAIEEQYDIILVVVTSVSKGPLKSSFANKIGHSLLIVNKQTDRKADIIEARDTLTNCIGMVLLDQKKKNLIK